MIKTDRTLDLSKDGETPYTLSFLYPYTQSMATGDNEGSSVLWLDYKGVSILFTGDAPTAVEGELLRDDQYGFFKDKGVELSDTEILKVAHHGSAYSTSMELLTYLNLQTAILSCGKGNAYGHPANEVLEKLEIVGADVYRTDEVGHIIVTVLQDGTYSTKTVKS